MVSLAEIGDPKNDFNLNLPRYIDSTEPEDLQDIDGHLRGGIPNRDIDALEHYWQVFPGVRATLFKKADRPGYSQLGSPSRKSRPPSSATPSSPLTMSPQPSFRNGGRPTRRVCKASPRAASPRRSSRRFPRTCSDTFEKARLLDPYDVYQHLMDYWAETMQDDVYMIVSDGWREAAKPRLIVEDKDRKTKEKPDFTVGKLKYKSELIPPALVIARYFTAEQAAIEKLEAEVAPSSRQLEEMAEEHGGEEGSAGGAKNEKDKSPRRQ